MKRNETLLIANSKKRQLTARGYKFLDKTIQTAAEQRGLTRYHKEMQEIKQSIKTMILDLIIDKKLDEEGIKKIISESLKSKYILQ